MTNNKKEDRRVRRTKKLLQIALIQLLKEKPLAKIQIKEIAELADVSRPTFYQHFETKEQLLFSHVDDLLNKMREIILEEVMGGDVFNLVDLLIASYKQWQVHHEALQWVLQVENKDILIDMFQAMFMELRPELDKRITPLATSPEYEPYILNFISAGLYRLVKMWVDNGMRESPERMAFITFLLFYNGFLPIRAEFCPDDPVITYAMNYLQSDI